MYVTMPLHPDNRTSKLSCASPWSSGELNLNICSAGNNTRMSAWVSQWNQRTLEQCDASVNVTTTQSPDKRMSILARVPREDICKPNSISASAQRATKHATTRNNAELIVLKLASVARHLERGSNAQAPAQSLRLHSGQHRHENELVGPWEIQSEANHVASIKRGSTSECHSRVISILIHHEEDLEVVVRRDELHIAPFQPPYQLSPRRHHQCFLPPPVSQRTLKLYCSMPKNRNMLKKS